MPLFRQNHARCSALSSSFVAKQASLPMNSTFDSRINFRSPSQFEAQLDVTIRARSHHWVARRHVGSGIGRTKRITLNRRVVGRQVTSIHTAEDRMVEHIEEFGSELYAESLFEFPILKYREVHDLERRVAEVIAAHISKRAGSRR
jgi:hypothetical protein